MPGRVRALTSSDSAFIVWNGRTAQRAFRNRTSDTVKHDLTLLSEAPPDWQAASEAEGAFTGRDARPAVECRRLRSTARVGRTSAGGSMRSNSQSGAAAPAVRAFLQRDFEQADAAEA
jgi:hypothetical protein